MHPSGNTVRYIEKAHVIAEGNGVEPDHLQIAAIYAQLAIADALVELNRTIHETLATGFVSIEVRDER